MLPNTRRTVRDSADAIIASALDNAFAHEQAMLGKKLSRFGA